MSQSRARAIKIIAFLALFILINWAIELAALRPRSLRSAVDSIALTTGLGAQLVEDMLVGAVAYLVLQIVLVLTDSLRFLTGEPRRQMRTPDELTHEHGAADR